MTAGPHAQIFEVVQQEAAKRGLNIQIIEFSDYVLALSSGDLDLNNYQHQPYLDNANADRGYKLVSIAKTVIFPIGIYSKKIKSLSEEGRRAHRPAIRPMAAARSCCANGLIKLRPEAGLKATPIDVIENPGSCASSNWTPPSCRARWTTPTPRLSTPTSRSKPA